jgi:hypothetical protein
MVFIKFVSVCVCMCVCVPVPHIFKGTVQWELRGIKTGINRSKSTKATENVYAPLVMVSLGAGKGHLPACEYIIMDRLIPILTPLSCHWTVPLRRLVFMCLCEAIKSSS